MARGEREQDAEDQHVAIDTNPANLGRQGRFINTVARLADGVSLEQANTGKHTRVFAGRVEVGR